MTWQPIMTGLTTKSSTEEQRLDSWASLRLFEQSVQHLTEAFTQLALSRLTVKQRSLLVAAHDVLRYYPLLSYSALADRLSRKLRMPLSTVKFNLRVLRDAGLLTTRQTQRTRRRRNTVALSHGGQLLVQILSK